MIRRSAAFTLIELITVMAIIAILSVSGSWLMVNLVKNSVFIPNQLNMDMLASDALNIMIEGDGRARGLRFSKAITSISGNNQLSFVNQDGQNIQYRLDTGVNKLYRLISAGPEAPVPYYLTSGINIDGKNSKFFTYYDAGDTETTNPVLVRRVKIAVIAKTGTGSYADWEGQSDQSSSIAVGKFQ